MVTLDGSQCNKIGVTHFGFQSQPNKCDLERGSCLKNQIKHLIEEDQNRKKKNLAPAYSASKYVDSTHGRGSSGLLKTRTERCA